MMGLIQKKGDLTDIMVFLISVFILAIGLFIFGYVIPTIADGLNDAGMNSSTEGANAIDEMGKIGTVTIQRGFFLLMVGLIMSMMVTSFLTRTHPIFLFLYIFLFGVSIFLGTYLGNAYESFSQTPIFAETLAQQTVINTVMSNLIKITLAAGAISLIIVFAKFSSGRAGGAQF